MATEQAWLNSVRKQPAAPDPGYVNWAWCPRSRDLSAELPALLAVLAARLGPIARVSYQPTAWDPCARHVNLNGTLARLGRCHCRNPDTADVTTSSGRHVTLAIIPPEHGDGAAHWIIRAASPRGGSARREAVLALPCTGRINAEPRRSNQPHRGRSPS